MNRLYFIAVCILSSCAGSADQTSKADKDSVVQLAPEGQLSPAESRAIAKEAYIYGYPLVDGYRIQYTYFQAKENTEYKAGYNVLFNTARVYTPEDKTVQTPNSDTPYSFAGLDLGTEPIVITVPAIEKNRYFSIQLVDAYTHNFDYIGSRATGNVAGNYLIAGPGWKGELPKGITRIIQSETRTGFALFRTQLINPGDMANVIKIQKGYKVQALSAFLGQPAPPAAPALDLIQPINNKEIKTSLQFFAVLNNVLQSCPTHPSETALMERFAKIGVGAGKTFDTTKFSPEIKTAIEQGRADAWAEFAQLKAKIDKKELASGDVFGTREFLKNNYLYRMAGAVLGIYGNTKVEAMYPLYTIDSEGKPLDGSNQYTLKFAAGKLPPVNAFWSLTMYELPDILLTKNPINRYLINSPMLPTLKKDADGGITIYVQSESPGKDKESNWLPAPNGPFMSVLRLYWPKEEALNASWTMPLLSKMR